MKIEGDHIKFEGDDKYFRDTLIGWVGVEGFHKISSGAIELKAIIMEMESANQVVQS